MNKNILLTIIVILLLIIYLISVKKTNYQVAPLPSPSPATNVPKEVKYDKSTDLKKELDSINPQVLESDFE